MGIRVIVFIGIGTSLFLILMSFGLKQSLKPRVGEQVPPGPARSPFDADRAWAHVTHLVGLGPRPSGSAAMAAQQRYVLEELRRAGLETRRQQFEAETPRGPLTMTNLWGVVAGTRPGVIVLSNHYDTRYFSEFSFVGANGAASATGWMLEMARAIGPQREGRSLWLLFFDGEESQGAPPRNEGLYGSRHMVSALRDSGELTSIETLVNVAMIGDCFLNISRDGDAPPWLEEIVWNTALRHGYSRHFGNVPLSIDDSPLPFREAGIPALQLIDFSYGGTQIDHRKNWHTAEDTLDKICPESLRAVGDVIYHALPVIDGQLDSIR